MTVSPLYSIVLPCHHCAQLCRQVVEGLLQDFTQNTCEIIIVSDDNSEADTKILHALCAAHPNVKALLFDTRLGKGCAVQRGLYAAHGKFVAYLDGDMAISPRHVKDFFSILESDAGVDIVIGNRTSYETHAIRKLTSRIYRLLNMILFRLPVRDTQAGIKAFTADAAKNIFNELTVYGYAFDIEVLVLAVRKHLNIREFSVQQTAKPHSSMTLGSVFRMVDDTLRIYQLEWMSDIWPLTLLSLRHLFLLPASWLGRGIFWCVQVVFPAEYQRSKKADPAK
ncbi:MAG: glycosyl transferase, family 2 [Candidatus Peribacteria bacterium]|nr:glycosyl transferase, family 2 [Candidatus Peribacteria bacterium]